MPTDQETLSRKRRLFIELLRAHFQYGANLHRNDDLFAFLARLHGIPAELYPAGPDVMFVRFLDPTAKQGLGEAGEGDGDQIKWPATLGDPFPHLETRFVKLTRGFDLRRLDLLTPVIVNLIFGAKDAIRRSLSLPPTGPANGQTNGRTNGTLVADATQATATATESSSSADQSSSTEVTDDTATDKDTNNTTPPPTPRSQFDTAATPSNFVRSRRRTEAAIFTTPIELPVLPPRPEFNQKEDDLVMLKTAEEELIRIALLPPQAPLWVKNLVVIPAISAGMALIFFDGPWISAPLALPLGLIAGGLSYLRDVSNPLFSYLFELFVSIFVGFFAAIFVGTNAFPGVCFGTLGLSGIVWLLPGLPLVLSSMELTTQTFSGASRLIYSIFLVFLMGFGLDAGLLLANFLPLAKSPVAECKPDGIDVLYYIPLFPLVAILHCIMLECTFPSHYLLSIPPAGIAFGLWVGLQKISWIQQAGAAGFGLVVLMSTFGGCFPGFLYARFTKRSAFPIVYMAMQFVVPGALSLKATLSGIASPAGFIGADFAARVLTGVLGCTVGAFTAHICTWPFREDKGERWTFMPYR